MPVTSLTYESRDGQRRAVITHEHAKRWSVRCDTRDAHKWEGVEYRREYVTTLGAAQAVARQWCDGWRER